MAWPLAKLSAVSVSYVFPPEDVRVDNSGGVITDASTLPEEWRTKRNTKAIGDMSEVMVIAALMRRGYLISIPFGENHRYDVIADAGDRIVRIQVKTGRLRNGVVHFSCSSSHQHRRSGPTAIRSYFGQIEYLAVFCPQNGKVYLVPESELVATFGHLRIAQPRNSQSRRIRWASEYELA